MPLQNRVTPGGEIVASSARGTFMGNRGRLHDEDRHIVRQSRSTAWLVCELEFNGRRREVMGPTTYTELFFLDEAVAFASGHRPCYECRRVAYRAYLDAANVVNAENVTRAGVMDQILRDARTSPRPHGALAELPDGAMVTVNGPDDFRLIWQGELHRWTHDGYIDRVMVDDLADRRVSVVTPALSVAALRGGYPIDVHHSATTPT